MAIMQDSTHPTGVRDDGRSSGRTLERARTRKAKAALKLREQDYTWDQIAGTLGYPTPRAALVAVEQALEEGLATDESQEFMRRLAGQKLEILLRSVMRKAKNPDHPEHLTAAKEARMTIMDHAKLHGYVAPQEVAIYTPYATEVEEFVTAIMRDRLPEQLEESDIFGDDAIEMVEKDGVFTEREQEEIIF